MSWGEKSLCTSVNNNSDTSHNIIKHRPCLVKMFASPTTLWVYNQYSYFNSTLYSVLALMFGHCDIAFLFVVSRNYYLVSGYKESRDKYSGLNSPDISELLGE